MVIITMTKDDSLEFKFKDLDLKKRYPNYFNIWVFRTGISFMVIILICILTLNNFDLSTKYYVGCPENSFSVCKNPFYECNYKIHDVINTINCEPYFKFGCPENLCEIEFFEPGEYVGEKPNNTQNNFFLICILIMILSFVINHILYIRGKNKNGNNINIKNR